MADSNRQGFTLVEVAIATMVLVVACLVVLMLLPSALRAQQKSRFHLLAALHAQNLFEGFFYHEMDLKGAYTTLHPRRATDQANGDANGGRIWEFGDPTDTFYTTLLTRDMRLMGPLGNYDLENVIGNRIGGNFPVPIDIARRLESPGDEIRKLLDNGGYVYYTDPINAGRLEAKVRDSGSAVTQRGDMQRLIWGVVGAPQQNLLPYDPTAVPYTELYPFPPQSRGKMVDRVYRGGYQLKWVEDGPLRTHGDTYGGIKLDSPVQVQRYRQELVGTSFTAADAAQVHEGIRWGEHEMAGYETNNWEWYARTEPGSPWERGIDAYRRLVNRHWLRILHQIDYIDVSGDGSSGAPSTTAGTIAGTREEQYIVTDGNGDVQRDAGGRPVTQTKQVPVSIGVAKAGAIVVEMSGGGGGGGGRDRGYPAPANGLGISHLRGTDILEEDAAAHVQDLANQIRISQPSLERRIMYRTAALRLWGLVYRGVDICQGVDPNIADQLALLAPADNPLTDQFIMPAVRDLHPTQILAASHLAHAAMMVTGYQPPFYDNRNSISAFDDDPLLPTDGDDATALDWEKHPEFGVVYEQLPYRMVEATCLDHHDPQDERPGRVEVLLQDGSLAEVPISASGRVDLSGLAPQLAPFLLDANGKVAERQDDGTGPTGVETTTPRIIDPGEYTYLWNPYHEDIMAAAQSTVHRSTAGPLGATGAREQYQVDSASIPIMYRRMAGGLLNGFPPPYADRGAIDLAGQRRYRTRWQLHVEWDSTGLIPSYRLLRKVVSGDEDPQDGDSHMAANAHENALRLAMAWVSENPYDLTVPKPLNRQTFVDRGLFQYDLFDASGRARRPAGLDRVQRRRSFYPVTFPVGSDRHFQAAFGAQNALPVMIDSMWDWGEPIPQATTPVRTNWRIDQTICVREQGVANQPFDFGRPYEVATEGWTSAEIGKRGLTDPWRLQRNHQRWINRLHGFDASDDSNQPLAKDATRFHATRTWEARDRTRQVVYWLVDWMQYEDAESAPSAPVDISRLEHQGRKLISEIRIKKTEGAQKWDAVWYGDGHWQIPEYFDATFLPTGATMRLRHDPGGSKMFRYPPDSPSDTEVFASHLDFRLEKDPILRVEVFLPADEASNDARFLAGNPESPFTWLDPERTATIHMAEEGALVPSQTSRSDGTGTWQGIAYLASGHTAVPARELVRFQGGFGAYNKETKISKGVLELNTFWSLGTFGADRNGDGVFTPGPVPRSTRMQATEIARINYYDPVAWLGMHR